MGVTGYPNAFVDVIFKCAGSYATWQANYNWAVQRINTQTAKVAPAGLELYFNRSGDTVTLETVVNLTENITGTYTVWMVVYEDTVSSYELLVRGGDTTPGTLSISNPYETETFTWEFDIGSGWDENDLWAAAWIEKDTYREVKQAIMVELDWGQTNIEEATFGQIKAMDF